MTKKDLLEKLKHTPDNMEILLSKIGFQDDVYYVNDYSFFPEQVVHSENRENVFYSYDSEEAENLYGEKAKELSQWVIVIY